MNKDWYEYKDPKNRFTLSFPEPPTVETDNLKGANNEEFVVESIGCAQQRNTTNREFAITISNIPAMYRLVTRNG